MGLWDTIDRSLQWGSGLPLVLHPDEAKRRCGRDIPDEVWDFAPLFRDLLLIVRETPLASKRIVNEQGEEVELVLRTTTEERLTRGWVIAVGCDAHPTVMPLLGQKVNFGSYALTGITDENSPKLHTAFGICTIADLWGYCGAPTEDVAEEHIFGVTMGGLVPFTNAADITGAP